MRRSAFFATEGPAASCALCYCVTTRQVRLIFDNGSLVDTRVICLPCVEITAAASLSGKFRVSDGDGPELAMPWIAEVPF